MLALNHKRTTSSLAPPIVYVKNRQLKDLRLPIVLTVQDLNRRQLLHLATNIFFLFPLLNEPGLGAHGFDTISI